MTNHSFRADTGICDICGRPRNRRKGEPNHVRCSKERQRINAHNHLPKVRT